jgi:methyl-accepting chemotaxis protein
MNSHIAIAANEQSIVVDTIHDNINDIVNLSSSTAQGAMQTQSSVENLNDAVQRITKFTDQFNVSD